MKKLNITLLALILSVFVLNAQSSLSTAQESDPAATQILEELKAEYDSYSSMQVDFEIEIEFNGEAADVQQGSLLQSGDQFVLKMPSQAIYKNGEAIWVHLIDIEEVQINDADMEDESAGFMTPNDIIALYESDAFVYGITNQEKEDGELTTQIEFKPLDRNSEYSKMRLTLNNGNKSMKRLKVFSKDGTRYTMHIKSLDKNVETTDADFLFDEEAFPDVNIEDLRF